MIVLGIESSCDETAVGIVDDHHNILANVLYSQVREHQKHGGVVPEIAARAHVRHLDILIQGALSDSGLDWPDIHAIAATCGPGLIGGVMVGMMTSKAICAGLNLPFIGVNHLEAHVLTARLSDSVKFPYMTLLVSGGHTQLLLVRNLGDYTLLGESLDDAAGEAFDKGAKMMGLPYPGGPHIDRLARLCPDPESAKNRFPLPHPLRHKNGCDFSFSGLKTALRETINLLPPGPIENEVLYDLCASLQSTIADILADRVARALPIAQNAGATCFVLSGGVAANSHIRNTLTTVAQEHGFSLIAPPINLCTDNGVMIAWAGLEYFRIGCKTPLDIPARPRWPLDDLKKKRISA